MIVYKVYRNVLPGTVIVFQGNQQILYNFSHNLSSLMSTRILAGRFMVYRFCFTLNKLNRHWTVSSSLKTFHHNLRLNKFVVFAVLK